MTWILLKDNAQKGRELIHEDYTIAKVLEVKEVDLINLNSQRLVFQHNVLRTGKLIYDFVEKPYFNRQQKLFFVL